jgi:hypothetical protein
MNNARILIGTMSGIAISYALNNQFIEWTRWAMATVGMLGMYYLAFSNEEESYQKQESK